MALATFQNLCIDAVDPRQMAAFWAELLGLRVDDGGDDDVRLVGASPQHTLYVNRVPEPVTVKQRVHFDVHAEALDDVLALGATPSDLESFRWKVVRDPEGGELCVFERETVPAYRLYEIGVDSADALATARWWAEVLGARVDEEDDWASVEDISAAPFECLVFAPVPEAKTVKNRIHWDVVVPDLGALVEAGARVLRERDDEISWTVMADPEGNEFCAFAPAEG
jgi:catechol 2,3-dioxygenase-like lactoylglutathione lyase family enzyme